MPLMQQEPNTQPMRAVVAAVHLPSVTQIEFEASLTELRELAKTLGYQVVGTFVQNRGKFDAAAYLGVGKRHEMRQFVEHGVVGEHDSYDEAEHESEQE